MKKFFIELSNRWKQESPNFHQKLINFGKWLVGTGLALAALPSAYQLLFPNAGIDLSLLIKIAAQMALVGLIIGAVAGTAVKNPNYQTIDKKEEK